MLNLILIIGIIASGIDVSDAQVPIDVLPTEMPHHISVQFHNSFWGTYESSASGVILDETHILSVRNTWPVEDLSVVSGITNLLSIAIGLGTRHTIKNVFPHPGLQVCHYVGRPNSDHPILNNLVIIEVVEPFNFATATRKPVQLPPANFALPSSGEVAAWMSSGLFDDALKKVTIPLINTTHCEDFYGKYRIRESMFCGAFLDEDGNSYDVIDTFDKGAVLMCREDENDPESPKVLCGLMNSPSYLNYLCDEPSGPEETGKERNCKAQETRTAGRMNYPVVFTKISDYLDWISDTLNHSKK